MYVYFIFFWIFLFLILFLGNIIPGMLAASKINLRIRCLNKTDEQLERIKTLMATELSHIK